MRKISLLFASLLFCYAVYSQPYPPVSYLGIDQGLSNNSVRGIYQDAKGFMWFASFDGLNRFDGYHFKVFRNDNNDSNSIVHNFLTCITGDRQSNLWIGTRQGLSAYDGLMGRFSTIKYLPAGGGTAQKLTDVIRALKTDAQDDALIGTEGKGLLFCKKGMVIARQIPLQTGNAVSFKYSVRAIEAADNGKIWVFVQNAGLCEFDPAAGRLLQRLASHMPAASMAIEGDHIWLSSELTLWQYTVTTGEYRQVLDLAALHVGASPIVTLTVDHNKQVWMGRNGEGIVIYDQGTHAVSRLLAGDRKNMLSSGSVYAVYEDREYRKWIGTDRGGVNMLDPRKNRFQLIQHDAADTKGLNSNVVQALYEDPSGLIWIGTEDKGVSIWDRKNNTFTVLRNNPADPGSLSQDNIRYIMGDHEHQVWVVTFAGGVNRYNARSKNFERYPFVNPVNGNRNEAILTMYEDRDNTIWVGTLRQGEKMGVMYQYNRAANKFELFDAGLSDVQSMQEDREGNLWGGTLDHLVKIDKHTKRHQYYFIGSPVWQICQDRQGYLWIATEGGGLFQFDIHKNAVVRRFTPADGLPSSSILKIIDVGNDICWLSTYNGLSRFDVAHKTFKNYYQSDGLQSNQFQYNAALKLRSGELLFGGVKGMSLFNPQQVVPVTHQPALLLTGITVNSVPVEQTDFIMEKDSAAIQAIRVPYNKAVLSFDFTALEYSSPDKIMYAYYLEGWDRKWNYTKDIRTASYTHLSEGKYTLRVKSTNAEGVWNPMQIALRIVILPPWYRTWWAYLLYTLCIGSLLYLYFSYKSKQSRLSYQLTIANLNEARALAERNEERAELEKERVVNEREKEINEKRLAFFTNISHEFRTPLTLIINPAKELIGQAADPQEAGTNLLRVIYRNARRMLSLVDQLLLFRKAETDTDKLYAAKLNCCHVCREVYLSFTQQAKMQQITYEFECGNEALEIYADREKLEIILYNLISNAMKYTPAGGHIVFQVTETETEVELSVSDNGYGIPESVGRRLFDKFYQSEGKGIRKPGFGIGLYLVKHFTELHRGSVAYESALEKGTVFRVTLLKGAEHLEADQLVAVPVQEGPRLLEELLARTEEPAEAAAAVIPAGNTAEALPVLLTEKKSMVVVDDDNQIRAYLVNIFEDRFTVYDASDGVAGLEKIRELQPDIVISDIKMEGITGIDLCKSVKEDASTSHIPVILLTGTSSPELQLEGVEGGADDYITKPFDKALLVARVNSLLKNRNNLQQYFFGEITLSNSDFKVSEEYKAFLDKCIAVVEKHLDEEQFTVKDFINEMGMSRSNLFRKVKEVSGLSINVFIRFIRLRKAAEILINTNHNVNETAAMVGIIDVQYFREQFTRLFGIKPSEYIKKYRKPFEGKYKVNRRSFRPGKE